jgi:Na+-transporting methylmalonyl-CoA/oxaloacetate decarboxylase gamma subunit
MKMLSVLALNFGLMLKEGLPIMGIGMLGIFLVIAVIILAVWLMSFIGTKKN